MLLRKEGFPEEDELVLCTVTAIHYHSVFVNLDEYGKSGMIHISEISPGRIRNIRDYVKEGKKVVCKVLRIHEDKGHIDLSLRRVNEGQKKEKISEIKHEQLAEKMVEQVAKQRKVKLEDLYRELASKILEKYDSLYDAFDDVSAGRATLEGLGVKPDVAKQLSELISLRIKPSEIEIGGELVMRSYRPDGVSVIKDAVRKAGKKAEIKYKGAGLYSVKVKSLDYKEAEKNLKMFIDTIILSMEANNSTAEFRREEK